MSSKHSYSKPVHTHHREEQANSGERRTPAPRSSYRYVVLNKPYGVLSQFTPELPGQRTLAEFHIPDGLYAAGRLDSDSEGLLLLTNDGPLIKQLLEPGNHERTYAVQVEGEITEAACERLASGVAIQDYRTLPARCTRLVPPPSFPDREPPIRVRKSIPTSWIELTLREGKNRQVRKMTAAVGYPTLRLIRVRIADITLGDLPAGTWRDLTLKELERLREAVRPRLSIRRK